MRIVGTYVGINNMTDYYHIYNDRSRLIGIDVSPEWAFFLCVDEVPDLAAWKKEFEIPGSKIIDCDDLVILQESLEMIITVRSGHGPRDSGHRLIHRPLRVSRQIDQYRDSTSHTAKTLNYRCIRNEDCWDLCLTKW